MSDINMTPLIDVMLVLLVIFMITAPLMSQASGSIARPRAPAQRRRCSSTVAVDAAGPALRGERRSTPPQRKAPGRF